MSKIKEKNLNKTTNELTNDEKNNKVKLLTQIAIHSSLLLTIISFIFSILPLNKVVDLRGAVFIPLILNSVMVALIIAITILYFVNKQRCNKATIILLYIFVIISISLSIMSVISNYCLVYKNQRVYGYNFTFNPPQPTSHYKQVYGTVWEFWVTFGFGLTIATLTTLTIIFNIIKKQILHSNKSSKNLEFELNEAKRLLDNNTLTEEEYINIRKTIIDKYYK